MATVDILPSAVRINNGWTNVGGTTTTAVNDSSDATYITDTVAGTGVAHGIMYDFATSTLPAGSVIKKITPKLRCSQAAGTQRLGTDMRVYSGGGTSGTLLYGASGYITPVPAIANYSLPSGGIYLASPNPAHPEWTPQLLVDNIVCTVTTNPADGSGPVADDHRVYQVWLTVEYNEQPVPTAIGYTVAGMNTITPRPAFSWTNSDPEGDTQAGYRAVIWLTADIADVFFTADKQVETSYVNSAGVAKDAVAWSGDMALSDPSQLGAEPVFACPVDLLPTSAYTLYVQMADSVGGTTRWATSAGNGTFAFTMAITPPAAPTLSAVWDATNARTTLTVQAANNLLSQDAADQETGLAGSWVAVSNATVSQQSSPTPPNGTFQRRFVAATTADSIMHTALFPVVAAKIYSFAVKGRSGAASRNFNLRAEWYDGVGTNFANQTGSNVAVNNSGWTDVTLVNTSAPAGAVNCKLRVTAVAPVAAENNYIDMAGAYPTTAAPAWSRGGLADIQKILIERSVDVGVSWTFLPQMSSLLGGTQADSYVNQALTTYDLATRHNTSTVYRARTIHDDGLYIYTSSNSATTAAVLPLFTRFWLRDPTNELYAVAVSITTGLEFSSTERMGVFTLVGIATPAIVSSVVGSEVLSIGVKLTGETAWLAFKALRGRKLPLILQTDMDGVAYWFRLQPDVSVSMPVSTNRQSATTRPRLVELSGFLGYAPQGQPSEVP